jgi:hypothetical protein
VGAPATTAGSAATAADSATPAAAASTPPDDGGGPDWVARGLAVAALVACGLTALELKRRRRGSAA